jgi:hypothetical protein
MHGSLKFDTYIGLTSYISSTIRSIDNAEYNTLLSENQLLSFSNVLSIGKVLFNDNMYLAKSKQFHIANDCTLMGDGDGSSVANIYFNANSDKIAGYLGAYFVTSDNKSYAINIDSPANTVSFNTDCAAFIFDKYTQFSGTVKCNGSLSLYGFSLGLPVDHSSYVTITAAAGTFTTSTKYVSYTVVGKKIIISFNITGQQTVASTTYLYMNINMNPTLSNVEIPATNIISYTPTSISGYKLGYAEASTSTLNRVDLTLPEPMEAGILAMTVYGTIILDLI